MSDSLRDMIGGMIQGGYMDSADPYDMAGQVLDVVAAEVRRRCTPSAEAYEAGGDALVYAVADWISPARTTNQTGEQ
jgi:hypothetical protein